MTPPSHRHHHSHANLTYVIYCARRFHSTTLDCCETKSYCIALYRASVVVYNCVDTGRVGQWVFFAPEKNKKKLYFPFKMLKLCFVDRVEVIANFSACYNNITVKIVRSSESEALQCCTAFGLRLYRAADENRFASPAVF